MATTTSPGSYPTLKVDHITNPYRFYAVPVIGILVKLVMIIPVLVVLIAYALVSVFTSIINSFVVLFSGKYWEPAYSWTLKVMRYANKIQLFMDGLTNKYPGFAANDDDPLMSVDMPMPTHPNRLFAIPVFGGLARIIMLLPFSIWAQIVQGGASLGVFVSFVPVLFSGKYPEATYELARDRQRLLMASTSYMTGLADKYPDFKISWNHKVVKIVLLVIGGIFALMNLASNGGDKTDNKYMDETPNYYQTDQMPSYDYDTVTPADDSTLQTQ